MKTTTSRVVFCWHMHQPYYKDEATAQFLLPWVYLHAIKDYTDMANILKAIPQARAVINFCPVLLEQISDYSEQIRNYFEHDAALNDPLLDLLVAESLPDSAAQKQQIIHDCLRANEHRLIKPNESYSALVELAARVRHHDMPQSHLSDHYYFDLLVWYHLAWMGETVRRSDARVAGLMNKRWNYTREDRLLLLRIIGELVAAIIPTYRDLAASGQIELSVTPYSHAMLPLLLNLESARESQPAIQLPDCKYPGGAERVAWQLERAIAVFTDYFGQAPAGCWPSEGGLSEAVLMALVDAGFSWTASGNSVRENSLRAGQDGHEQHSHRPYQCQDLPIQCFFRDDKLSDLIGFTYSSWHGDDAADNLVEHLLAIHHAPKEPGFERVISIILDGENCWEYYSNNGYFFLMALYQKLVSRPEFRLSTFSQAIRDHLPAARLDPLVAGSWVYGNFSTWIGDADKNRAWELLCDAKNAVDTALENPSLDPATRARIEKQLAICEGSDWFWWLGDYNPAASVHDFDALYRKHLRHLYRLLGRDGPAALTTPISTGAAAADNTAAATAETGGVMRRSQAH